MGAARSWSLSAVLLGGCLSPPTSGDKPADPDAAPGVSSDCVTVDFEETFDEEGWQAARWGASDEDAAGTLLAAGGRAVIAPSGEADVYGWFATSAAFDFEDRCVHVDVPVMLDHADGLDTEAYLGVYLGEHWVAVGQSGGKLCCEHELDDEEIVARCEELYAADAHARWRLRFEAGQVVCDVAPVDGAWAEYRRMDYGGPLTGWIELLAGTWDDVDSPGQVAFDNLNL